MGKYLIIAGTSTIGTCTAKKLLQNGHEVFITGRTAEKTQQLASELKVDFSLLDATDVQQVHETVALALERMQSLDGIVNCAGSLLLKAAHLTSAVEFMATLNANLMTAFAVCSAAGKYFSSTGGSIVLISSAAALRGLANHEAIAAAKSGIIGLARSAAATYASNNIRFNVVAPGLVESHLTSSLTTNVSIRKVSEAMHALGRIGQPDHVAEAIIFFLNPKNDWVTGQVLAIDGGLSSLFSKNKI